MVETPLILCLVEHLNILKLISSKLLFTLNNRRPLTLMMTPTCPRLLNMINGFVALPSSGSEDLSAIEDILLLLLLFIDFMLT